MITGVLERLVSVADVPEPPPDDPFPTILSWFDDARHALGDENARAMALATATPEGVPSVRFVLCKAIEADAASITFFTNYLSRKGLELAANPRAAVAFYWPHSKRQVRMEGQVHPLPDAENDAYFRTRPLLSRIGAVVSRQSAVIDSRAELVARATRLAASAVADLGITRPTHWGGYRLHVAQVELWSAREGRLHQRVRWRRPGSWSSPTPDPTPASNRQSSTSSPWIIELLSP